MWPERGSNRRCGAVASTWAGVVAERDEAGASLPDGRTLYWLGAHGGAVTTTVRLATGLGPEAPASCLAHGTWPVLVVVVARTHARGLIAAQQLAVQLASRGAGPGTAYHLAGLVLVADAPGKLPKPLAELAQLVSGGYPGHGGCPTSRPGDWASRPAPPTRPRSWPALARTSSSPQGLSTCEAVPSNPQPQRSQPMTSTQRAGLSRRAKALRALPATALATATGTATTLLLAGTAWAAVAGSGQPAWDQRQRRRPSRCEHERRHHHLLGVLDLLHDRHPGRALRGLQDDRAAPPR